MAAFTLAPALILLAAFQRVSPLRPLRTLVRTTEERLHPRQVSAHALEESRAAQWEAGGGLYPNACYVTDR